MMMSSKECKRQQTGLIRINCSGSVLNSNKNGACGGLVRDHNGDFVAAFSANVGFCTLTIAKLWGLYTSLKLAESLGFSNIEVECDSMSVINLLNRRDLQQRPNKSALSLVQAVKDLMARNWSLKLTYINQEANNSADILARNGHTLSHGVVFYDSVPTFLTNFPSCSRFCPPRLCDY